MSSFLFLAIHSVSTTIDSCHSALCSLSLRSTVVVSKEAPLQNQEPTTVPCFSLNFSNISLHFEKIAGSPKPWTGDLSGFQICQEWSVPLLDQEILTVLYLNRENRKQLDLGTSFKFFLLGKGEGPSLVSLPFTHWTSLGLKVGT